MMAVELMGVLATNSDQFYHTIVVLSTIRLAKRLICTISGGYNKH